MRIATLLVVCVLAVPKRASAEPIGLFEWVHDNIFSESAFIVTNTSENDFFDVFVDLYAPAAMTPFF